MYRLTTLIILTLILTACSGTDEPAPPQPTDYTFTIDPPQPTIAPGEELTLTTPGLPPTVTPLWSTSDPTVLLVDRTGKIHALKQGTATVTATAGTSQATCTVTVRTPIPDPQPGHLYFSDGTWGPTTTPGKTPIAVIFSTIDPTASDPILRAQHPGCTHGLAVAATASTDETPWQKNWRHADPLISTWVTENLKGYTPTQSLYQKDTRMNLPLGYNNTQAYIAYQTAYPLDTIQPIARISAFHKACPAPESSSGWYLPSVYELFLLFHGTPDNPEILDATRTLSNLPVINQALATAPQSTLIADPKWAYDLWSSTEYLDGMAYFISSDDGRIAATDKANTSSRLTRYIIAF